MEADEDLYAALNCRLKEDSRGENEWLLDWEPKKLLLLYHYNNWSQIPYTSSQLIQQYEENTENISRVYFLPDIQER